MKKYIIVLCVTSVLVFSGCGMSAKEKIELQQAENRAKALEIQRQRDLAEQIRRNQLTPEQRHQEDLEKIRTEQEQYKTWGKGANILLCMMGGC